MTDVDAVLEPTAVEARRLEDDGAIPNNPELPLLVYRRAVTLPEDDPAAVFEALFTENGWPAAWRNGIHPFHHFHSTAHEALGVYRGTATPPFRGRRRRRHDGVGRRRRHHSRRRRPQGNRGERGSWHRRRVPGRNRSRPLPGRSGRTAREPCRDSTGRGSGPRSPLRYARPPPPALVLSRSHL